MFCTIIKGYLFDLITEEILEAVEVIQEMTDVIVFDDFTIDGMYEVIVHTDSDHIVAIENLLAPLM